MSSEQPSTTTDTNSRTGWWFFPCVVVASLLYVAVTVSPRLVHLDDLKREYFNQQLTLLELEAECIHQEKINRELRRNPEFARWVSLEKTSETPPTNEPGSIPLKPDLQFDGLASEGNAAVPHLVEYASPHYVDLVRQYERNPLVHRFGMAIAGLLVVIGFLPSKSKSDAESHHPQKSKKGFFQRYRRNA